MGTRSHHHLDPQPSPSYSHRTPPLRISSSSTVAMFSRQALRSVRAAAPVRVPAMRAMPARSFAAAANADAQPPVAVFGLDGTYATALSKLSALIAKDSKLSAILSAPTLSAEDKSAIVAELAKQSGAQGPTIKNFLDALAENNRLGLLGGVCEKFETIHSAARGEVEMTVTSAQNLDSKTLSRLEAAVSKSSYVGAGKKLKVTNEVNPDIVGGLIVEVGDRTIDLSVSSRIAKMNKLLNDSL